MSIIRPHVHDCTKAAGWHQDLPAGAIAGLIGLSDVWPGDMFVATGGIILKLVGDASWHIIDTTTGKIRRNRRALNYIEK